ncbi:MAG: hypothetical protein AAF639_17425 [Chloroflexota bacterium]
MFIKPALTAHTIQPHCIQPHDRQCRSVISQSIDQIFARTLAALPRMYATFDEMYALIPFPMKRVLHT